MNYLFNNFKRFFEEIDQTLEKRSDADSTSEDPAGSNYFDTLEDEFGIEIDMDHPDTQAARTVGDLYSGIQRLISAN